MFCKKGVQRNFTKFTGKHLCLSLFFNKVAGLRSATLLKKRLRRRCFPVNFVKFLRATFYKEHLWWLLLTILFGFYFIATFLRSFNQLQNHLKFYNFDHDFEVRCKFFRELLCSYFKIIITFTLLHTGPPYMKRKGTKRRETDQLLTFFLFMLYIN